LDRNRHYSGGYVIADVAFDIDIKLALAGGDPDGHRRTAAIKKKSHRLFPKLDQPTAPRSWTNPRLGHGWELADCLGRPIGE